MSAWLRDHGVIAERKPNVIHLPGHLVLEAVRNGDGVSLSTRVNVERDLAAGRLVVLFEETRPRPRLPHRHPPRGAAPAAQGVRRLAAPPGAARVVFMS